MVLEKGSQLTLGAPFAFVKQGKLESKGKRMTNSDAVEWFDRLLPVAVGLAIAGTGGWSVDRWLAALPVMGISAARQAGYEKGYATFNPNLRGPEQQG